MDEYLNRVVQLVWNMGYLGRIIIDKTFSGLTSELRMEWAKVMEPPNNVPDYMESLWTGPHPGNVEPI